MALIAEFERAANLYRPPKHALANTIGRLHANGLTIWDIATALRLELGFVRGLLHARSHDDDDG
jgi:hypothetical protein